MTTKVLRLIVDRPKFYYVADRSSYEILRSLRLPFVTCQYDMLPALVQTMKHHNIQLLVRRFVDVETETLDKVSLKWAPHSLTYSSSSVVLEFPKTSVRALRRAESLTDALVGFYDRHCYSVVVKDRRLNTRIRRTLQKVYHADKQPYWK